MNVEKKLSFHVLNVKHTGVISVVVNTKRGKYYELEKCCIYWISRLFDSCNILCNNDTNGDTMNWIYAIVITLSWGFPLWLILIDKYSNGKKR